MNKVTYFFKLWTKRAWSERSLKNYFDTYAPLEWFDREALDAAKALAED